MADGRLYSAAFSNVTISATQDIFSLLCSSTVPIEVVCFVIGQITSASVANLRISFHRLTATVSNGSAGSVVTPRPSLPNDAAAVTVCHANDTTPATTSGTNQLLSGDALNVVNGYQFWYPRGERWLIAPLQSCTVSLDTAPASGQVMNGTIWFAEKI